MAAVVFGNGQPKLLIILLMVLAQVAASLVPVIATGNPVLVAICVPLTLKVWQLPQFAPLVATFPVGLGPTKAACAVAAKIIKIPQNNITCSTFVLVFVDAIIDIIDIIIAFPP